MIAYCALIDELIPLGKSNQANDEEEGFKLAAMRYASRAGILLKRLRCSSVVVPAPRLRHALSFQETAPSFVSFVSPSGITRPILKYYLPLDSQTGLSIVANKALTIAIDRQTKPSDAISADWTIEKTVHPNRIVIKIGTGVLTGDDHVVIDEPAFLEIARAVAQLKALSYEVILVSSGAVGAGLTDFGIKERPKTFAVTQAYAAVGQPKLLSLYRKHLSVWSLTVGQILLTYRDFESEECRGLVLDTLEAMLAMGSVIPIINENDAIAPEHEKFDGNDIVAANLAALCGARQLLMLTTVDGLLARNEDGSQKLVREVANLEEAMELVEESKGIISIGGMQSKLEAVQFALSHGVETFIANGKSASKIPEIIDGEYQKRTRFTPDFEPQLHPE